MHVTYFIAPIQINLRASLECEAAIDDGTIHDVQDSIFDILEVATTMKKFALWRLQLDFVTFVACLLLGLAVIYSKENPLRCNAEILVF